VLLEYFDNDEVVELDADIWKITGADEDEDNKAYKSFETLAKLIQTRTERNVDRDVFSLEYGGFDHHNDMKVNLKDKLKTVNSVIRRLVEQLKSDKTWDKVTIIVASEFGRTITQNSNEGSDHGWGGNTFILGGDLAGGRVLGQYPDDITMESRLNAGRSNRVRMIPTTSWEAIFNGIAGWFADGFNIINDDEEEEGELTEEDLDYILPNRNNVINPVENEGDFPLYTKDDLYN